MKESDTGRQSFKERFNRRINSVADSYWEDMLQDISRRDAKVRMLRKISGASLIDALALEILNSLARVSGGRVVRSRMIVERLPNLNRDLYRIDLPEDRDHPEVP